MNEMEYKELVEAGWRRRLTAAEEAQLRAWMPDQPGKRDEAEAELGLNRLLERLPDAPVASNFTARVLQAARPPARPFLAELWQRLFPRPAAGVAWLVVVICLGGLAYQQASYNSQRQRARELADFTKAAAISDPQFLADFEAIRHLPQTDDEELFTVLNQ